MLKILTPYLFLVIITFNFNLLTQYDGGFASNLFKHIDYLVTNLTTERQLSSIDANYSVFSDKMICNQTNLVKFYPELIKFKKEANRRNLKCYYYNLNTAYFYTSFMWFKKNQ